MSTPNSLSPETVGVERLDLAKEELRNLQSSGVFDRSGGLWILLDYVCNKYFEGSSDQLKEYTIAVEAFGRPPEFDKKRDSIVRVEAHRLRKRLDQYYSSEGASRPVHIAIPPGQYAPRFIIQADVQTVPAKPLIPLAPPSGPILDERNTVSRWIAAAACVIFAVGLGFAMGWIPRSSNSAKASVNADSAASRVALPGAEMVPGDTVRLMAGSGSGNTLDSTGRTWSKDQFFTGGTDRVGAFRTILRTKDTSLYLSRRVGDFRYDIPLKPGVYEMRLFFAETSFGDGNLDGGGETSRLFRVQANGDILLENFDIILDATGPNTADIKVFRKISPASDGKLHLVFQSQKDRALLNAIELIPGDGHKLHPIRFVARETGFTDNHGQAWLPESFALGGRLALRQQEVAGTPDPGLYQSERYGNFSYAIPVAPGRYTVILHFAEAWHGPQRGDGSGPGSRVFDVYCNGVALLESFDIFKEAGRSFKAVEKKFTGLRANAQGKLNISFVSQRNYALVNAIEVIDEGN